MLITSSSRRIAVFAPLTFYAVSGFILTCAVLHSLRQPSASNCIMFLLGVSICATCLADTRLITVRANRLSVRSPFSCGTVNLQKCVFEFDIKFHPRGGPTYLLYARDARHRLKVGETWLRRSACRACQRLEQALIFGGHEKMLTRAAIEGRASSAPPP